MKTCQRCGGPADIEVTSVLVGLTAVGERMIERFRGERAAYSICLPCAQFCGEVVAAPPEEKDEGDIQ
jgi:hypothetical protein